MNQMIRCAHCGCLFEPNPRLRINATAARRNASVPGKVSGRRESWRMILLTVAIREIVRGGGINNALISGKIIETDIPNIANVIVCYKGAGTPRDALPGLQQWTRQYKKSS